MRVVPSSSCSWRCLTATVPQSLYQPPIALGGSSSGPIPYQPRPQLRRRRARRTAVEVALSRPTGADSLVDHLNHLQHPVPAIYPDRDHIAHPQRRSRLGDGTVNRHMSTLARFCGDSTGLEDPDRPKPPIHPGGIHSISLPPAFLSPTGVHRRAQIKHPKIRAHRTRASADRLFSSGEPIGSRSRLRRCRAKVTGPVELPFVGSR
jgi:hypothetical protein